MYGLSRHRDEQRRLYVLLEHEDGHTRPTVVFGTAGSPDHASTHEARRRELACLEAEQAALLRSGRS